MQRISDEYSDGRQQMSGGCGAGISLYNYQHPLLPKNMSQVKPEPGPSLSVMHGAVDVKELLEHLEPAHQHTHGAHRCPDCGKCFSKQDRLKRHQSMHAADRQRWDCPDCNKSFKWERSLSQHVKIHSDTNPHVCSVCRKSFSKRCHLESHLRTHIDDHKRFSCPECGKSFKWEKSLTAHCRTHAHDLYYHCRECGKSFRKHKSYSQHHKVHSADNPYACHACGRAFGKRSHYEGHLKIHSEQQTYACADCDKSFKWEKSLSAHRLLHNLGQELPHKCHICSKTFTRADSLKKHVNTHAVKRELKSEPNGMIEGSEAPAERVIRGQLKYIHALPFDSSTSEEQIKSYMQRIEQANYDVEKHTTKEFASFKIGVPPPCFDKFMQAGVWPENMYVKEWQSYQWPTAAHHK